ncbi:MAG: hypothetical protein ACPG8W_17890 [Candidatus Promineifilaceae bacterium]
MGTNIDARIWVSDGLKPNERFIKLVECVAKWPQVDAVWTGIRIIDRTPAHVILKHYDALDTDSLKTLVAAHDGAGHHISITIRFRCWRFVKGEPKSGYAHLRLASWGEEYVSAMGRDYRFEGNASISIIRAGPYVALLDSYRGPVDRVAVNEKVEENLAQWTELLFMLIDSIRPKTVKVYTDSGEFININAHMAYFRSAQDVLDDFSFLDELWQTGSPTHRLPPLNAMPAKKAQFVYHPWRSKSQQSEVDNRLRKLIPNVRKLNATHIENALASQFLDYYTIPTGFLLLEYPHTFNAFLDRFYLYVLEQAN